MSSENLNWIFKIHRWEVERFGKERFINDIMLPIIQTLFQLTENTAVQTMY